MTLAFNLFDYAVFIAMLAVSAAIGIYFAYKDRKTNSTEQFLLGDRKLSIFPVAMSILASFTSVIIMFFLVFILNLNRIRNYFKKFHLRPTNS